MKKLVLSIAVVVMLAACSTNTTSTSSSDTCKKDSVCTDSICVDSLIKTSEARIDTMRALLQDIKK